MRMMWAVLGGFTSVGLGLLAVRLYDPAQLQLITCFSGMTALVGLFIIRDLQVDSMEHRAAPTEAGERDRTYAA